MLHKSNEDYDDTKPSDFFWLSTMYVDLGGGCFIFIYITNFKAYIYIYIYIYIYYALLLQQNEF